VSSRGAKKIPSICSEQDMRSHEISCHCEEQSDEAISTFFLMRFPRPFRARNDIVKIYIAFILINEFSLEIHIFCDNYKYQQTEGE